MKLNTAEQLTILFYHLRGTEQPKRKRPDHSCYKPYKPTLIMIHPRRAGTYGYQYNGKSRRPANTYRAVRRNFIKNKI